MKPISHHLERWRAEPEARRERRALLAASGLTLVLFVLWLASFRLSATLRSTPTVAATASPGVIERIQAGWRVLNK